MVTQELIDYIKTQKQQNIPDGAIKNNLLNSHWKLEDINSAFLQISAPYVNSQTEDKPKIVNVISALMFIIASLYIITTVSMLGIIVVMDRSMSSGYLVFSFLKFFPTFGTLPVMFSFVTFFFFYLAFKIRNGSIFSLFLSFLSLVIIPALAAFITQMSVSPILKLTSSDSGTDNPATSLPLNQDVLRLGDPIFILAIIIVVLMAFSFKKFHFNNDPLSGKAKAFLALVFALLVVPAISIISLSYIKAQDTDYGYTKATTAVSYHIYKPGVIPNGLTYASKFIIGKELAGKQNAVQTAFDVPLIDDQMKSTQSKAIVVKQVGVESGFNLEVFAPTFLKDSTLKKITLSKAVDQTGYLLQKKLEKLMLSAVVYLTKDNVLITLISPKASPEELTQFAESLE